MNCAQAISNLATLPGCGGVLVVSGDSGNVTKSGKKIIALNVNGIPFLP